MTTEQKRKQRIKYLVLVSIALMGMGITVLLKAYPLTLCFGIFFAVIIKVAIERKIALIKTGDPDSPWKKTGF